jgi:hypothetical protein
MKDAPPLERRRRRLTWHVVASVLVLVVAAAASGIALSRDDSTPAPTAVVGIPQVQVIDLGPSAESEPVEEDVPRDTAGEVFVNDVDEAREAILEDIEESRDAPYAWAGGPYVGKTGTVFTLDGRGSYGRGAQIVKYEWDVDGDGTYEYTRTTPTVRHAYTEDFDGSVRLRVTDEEGRVAVASTVGHASVDGDEQPADVDNCPAIANHGQGDSDGDGLGDECDPTPWPKR